MILDFNMRMCDSLPIESVIAVMTVGERNILFNLIKKLDDNSKIVEVGSAFGGSACIMAAANPTIEINCIDKFYSDNIYKMWQSGKKYHYRDINTWYDIHNISNNERKFEWYQAVDESFNVDLSGKLAFESLTKRFTNIKLHHGLSPLDFLNWKQPIDLYFEDAAHQNPELNLNINFWKEHIKPGGIIVGHDYQVYGEHKFPDVVYEFNNLISNGWNLITKIDSLIILQKPI
jgi:predicted O-methyltransferase YrrM